MVRYGLDQGWPAFRRYAASRRCQIDRLRGAQVVREAKERSGMRWMRWQPRRFDAAEGPEAPYSRHAQLRAR